jgi:hypothetical protein
MAEPIVLRCPQCKEPLTTRVLTRDVTSTRVTRRGPATQRLRAYGCPHCGAALSIGVDPDGLLADIERIVTGAIRRHRP